MTQKWRFASFLLGYYVFWRRLKPGFNQGRYTVYNKGRVGGEEWSPPNFIMIDVRELLAALDANYPQRECYLHYEDPWQLMVATILSAQCTDARVNMVTPVLFSKYPTAEALADADFSKLCEEVRSTGFYRNKAGNIIASMKKLTEEYGGVMPRDIGALTGFPGVGRKTANVVLGHAFGIPGVVVDTHVARVSRRLGLTQHNDPVKIEYELMEILPKEHWIRYNTQIIAHGRAVCAARKPLCDGCPLAGLCPKLT